MRKTLTLAAALMISLAAFAGQKVRFMPQWTPQAQFAGYYMALEKGFYAEEGLDVEIRHLGTKSGKSSFDYLVDGEVDIVSLQLAQAICLTSSANPIVNVLQTSQNSGLMCVSQTPLEDVHSLEGKKIGRWRSGFAQLADMMFDETGVHPEWIYFAYNINLFISKAIDATLCYSYSEYLNLLFARGSVPEENVLRFSDVGYNFPEDGLYVKKDYIATNRETILKFIRATKKGWRYAAKNEKETLDVVMRIVRENDIVTNLPIQTMMLRETLRLQNGENGEATYAPASPDLFVRLNDYLVRSGLIDEPVDYKSFVKTENTL